MLGVDGKTDWKRDDRVGSDQRLIRLPPPHMKMMIGNGRWLRLVGRLLALYLEWLLYRLVGMTGTYNRLWLKCCLES
jgi:hypothetical protein